MPQSAWETLLRVVDQLPPPPFTPKAPCRWIQTTHPQAWAIGTLQAPPPPHHHPTTKAAARGAKRSLPAKRQRRVQGEGSTPTGKGTPRAPQGNNTRRTREKTRDGARNKDKDRGKQPQRGKGQLQVLAASWTDTAPPPHTESAQSTPPRATHHTSTMVCTTPGRGGAPTGHHCTRARAPKRGNPRDTHPPCQASRRTKTRHHTSRIHHTESRAPTDRPRTETEEYTHVERHR